MHIKNCSSCTSVAVTPVRQTPVSGSREGTKRQSTQRVVHCVCPHGIVQFFGGQLERSRLSPSDRAQQVLIFCDRHRHTYTFTIRAPIGEDESNPRRPRRPRKAPQKLFILIQTASRNEYTCPLSSCPMSEAKRVETFVHLKLFLQTRRFFPFFEGCHPPAGAEKVHSGRDYYWTHAGARLPA